MVEKKDRKTMVETWKPVFLRLSLLAKGTSAAFRMSKAVITALSPSLAGRPEEQVLLDAIIAIKHYKTISL